MGQRNQWNKRFANNSVAVEPDSFCRNLIIWIDIAFNPIISELSSFFMNSSFVAEDGCVGGTVPTRNRERAEHSSTRTWNESLHNPNPCGRISTPPYILDTGFLNK